MKNKRQFQERYQDPKPRTWSNPIFPKRQFQERNQDPKPWAFNKDNGKEILKDKTKTTQKKTKTRGCTPEEGGIDADDLLPKQGGTIQI